jgi:protein phosphatase PTC2/3
MIVRDPEFPQNPKAAIARATADAEKTFLHLAHTESNHVTGEV